jgi:hypothetical protein
VNERVRNIKHKNKQRTKLRTIKETKLECIRTLEQEINNTHATNGKDCISGKKTPKRKGDIWVPSSSKGGLLDPQILSSSYK